MGPDVQDLFIEQLNAAGLVATPKGWESPKKVHEVIHVKGQPDDVFDVLVTRQRPKFFWFPDLPPGPYHDPMLQPWAATLRDAWQDIRDEAVELLPTRGSRHPKTGNPAPFQLSPTTPIC